MSNQASIRRVLQLRNPHGPAGEVFADQLAQRIAVRIPGADVQTAHQFVSVAWCVRAAEDDSDVAEFIYDTWAKVLAE